MNFILIKSIFFQINKLFVFLKLFKDLSNSFYKTLASIFSIKQDVIIVYNNKNTKYLF